MINSIIFTEASVSIHAWESKMHRGRWRCFSPSEARYVDETTMTLNNKDGNGHFTMNTIQLITLEPRVYMNVMSGYDRAP